MWKLKCSLSFNLTCVHFSSLLLSKVLKTKNSLLTNWFNTLVINWGWDELEFATVCSMKLLILFDGPNWRTSSLTLKQQQQQQQQTKKIPWGLIFTMGLNNNLGFQFCSKGNMDLTIRKRLAKRWSTWLWAEVNFTNNLQSAFFGHFALMTNSNTFLKLIFCAFTQGVLKTTFRHFWLHIVLPEIKILLDVIITY